MISEAIEHKNPSQKRSPQNTHLRNKQLEIVHKYPSSFQEVVELDGKVTKVIDSIESLQDIIQGLRSEVDQMKRDQDVIQGLKSEVDQLKRDHCAIMQYLINIPVSWAGGNQSRVLYF